MKKILMILTLLMLIIVACTPQAATEEPVILPDEPTPSSPKPTPTHLPVDLTPAQRASIAALSETLGLPADEIKLVSTEAVIWPDGCLGVQRMGMMCTQAQVEGFRIILEADSKQYEFHTNQQGSAVVLAQGTQAASSIEEEVVKQLAGNLGLDESDVLVVSDAEIEFGDACLGVAMQEIACAQVVTAGRIIVLEANGVEYEYHTNADGSHVQPATFALTWKREGGIAGFCDYLTVFRSGEVYINRCHGEPEVRMGTFADLLLAGQRAKYDQWVDKFGQVDLDESNPVGVADRMVLTLAFFGNGTGEPVKADEEALFTWAQDLYQKLSEQ